MKKIKHICINLDEAHYNALLKIANDERRNITNTAYLFLIEAIEKNILKYTQVYDGDYESLKFY